MKTPKISIIIPSYNHAHYIQQSIDSVIAQSVKDWELIIIDDASTDDSKTLLEKQDDPRIQVYYHTGNQGAHNTINEGLARARGDYLTVLNSDDVYHPERLQALYQAAQAYDFVASDINLINAEGQVTTYSEDAYTQAWLDWHEGLKQNYRMTQNFFACLLEGNFLITTSNFFFHRRVWEKLGGFADLRYMHDYEFSMRVMKAGFKAAFLPEKLLSYRLHDSNTIREAPLQAIQENTRLLLQQLPALPVEKEHLQAVAKHLSNLYRYTNEEWATEVHQRLVQKETELFPLIEDRNHWIAERDQWIQERDTIIQEQAKTSYTQQTYLEEQHRQLAEKDQYIQQQQHWLADREAWVQDRDTWIAERDQLIQQQQNWISDRDTWIAERDSWIVERDQHIQALEHDIADMRASRVYQFSLKWAMRIKKLQQFFLRITNKKTTAFESR
jgi:glycosyltransferase involved in cell wall biosynthesis